MGWWITLGVVTLLAILPLGVRVCYDSAGPLVKVVLGPVKIKVYPRPKKTEKPKKETKTDASYDMQAFKNDALFGELKYERKKR